MKRAVYLLLCLLTCVAFTTACGKDSTDTDTTTSVAQESTLQESTENTTSDDEAGVPDEDPLLQEEATDEEMEAPEENTVPIQDAEETEETEEPSTTDAQENVQKKPSKKFHASGTFNGFVDSTSIEVTMEEGYYQTFFVFDEDVLKKLQEIDNKGENPTIRFTYRNRKGQINPEIIEIR